MTLEMPQTMPWLNQLVMMCALTPEAKSTSPSVETMERETVRPLRLARTRAQIMAKGVREAVQPPSATWSPSPTSAAAASSEVTLSRRRRSRALVFARRSR